MIIIDTITPTVQRINLAVGHAAEMVVIELDDGASIDDTGPRAAYNMAIEILAALLDLDGPPAKAVLDNAIARLLDGKTDLYGLDAPITPPLTFDQVEAAGLDATLRRIA